MVPGGWRGRAVVVAVGKGAAWAGDREMEAPAVAAGARAGTASAMAARGSAALEAGVLSREGEL